MLSATGKAYGLCVFSLVIAASLIRVAPLTLSSRLVWLW